MVTTLVIRVLTKRRSIVNGQLEFLGKPLEAAHEQPFNTFDELDLLLNDHWKVVAATYIRADGVHLLHYTLYKPPW